MKRTENVQRRVVDELAWDSSVDSSGISVTVSGDGVVTLEGAVPTCRVRAAAEKAAGRVTGVRAVANDLEVRLLPEARREDTELAEAAVRALRWHSSVPEDDLRVVVEDGWVTLQGTVRWQHERRAAHRAIRNLTGVKGVNDRIRLDLAAQPDDVREQIRSAFERSARVNAEGIEVEIDGSIAVLRGEVPSRRDREEAERAAWSAPGITEVENRIEVKGRALRL